MRSLRPLLAVSLCAGLAWPIHAIASAETARPFAFAPARERRGTLEVDATALGGSAKLISDRIHEMAKVIFDSEAVRAADGPDDPVMKVLIVPLEGDTAGYRITYHVERGGEKVPGSEGRSDCRLCTEGELVDAAVAGIELSVEKMEVVIEETPVDTGATSGPATSGDEGSTTDLTGGDDGPPDDRGGRLGVMGKAGIALTVVGAAGLGTGIGLAVAKPKPSDDMPTKRLETQKPGYGVLAAGAAIAVTGVVLLVLDLRKGKRDVGTPGARTRTRLSPWVGLDRSSGGVSLSRRF